jgi:hypothetical protein
MEYQQETANHEHRLAVMEDGSRRLLHMAHEMLNQ